jgi:streptogramin lyase
MITFTLNLAVSPLPNGGVWFANAQAWTNYWSNIGATGQLDPITTTKYVPLTATDDDPVQINIDGNIYYIVKDSSYKSLLAKVNQLDSNFQTMRQQFYDAGLITEAQ